MARLIWLAIGYLCGSIQTGYFLGKLKGIDIRDYGSHSTGATNSLRVMGTGAGILVLLGDALKAILPCIAVRCIYADNPDLMMVLLLWTGAGVMLGGVLQATINYNLALGKTAEVNNGVVSDALHQLENIEAKTNAWQLGLAVYF